MAELRALVDAPLLVGSDGAIVGTSIKTGDRVDARRAGFSPPPPGGAG